jgi:uncharacterized protein YceK
MPARQVQRHGSPAVTVGLDRFPNCCIFSPHVNVEAFMPRLVPLLVPALVFSLAGCGTFSDAMCGPVGPGYDYAYYRGVRFDALAVKEGGPMVLMGADMPLSAIADTVLVPFIAYNQLTNSPSRSSILPTDEQTKVEPTKSESTPKQASLPSR